MSFGGGSKGPSAAQIQAQQSQDRLARIQEQQLAQQETERMASMRARAGRMGGRSLLMLDDTGFFKDGTDGMQKRLGNGWRDAPASAATPAAPAPANSATGDIFARWFQAA